MFRKYPILFSYKGILKTGIFIKLIIEMNGYGITAEFSDDVIYKINDYLIDWIKRYVKFFKEKLTTDVFITTHNIIYNESKLKKCIIDKILEYNNYLNVSIISKIGNDYYLSFSKEFMPPAFINRFKLPFSLDSIKQIMENEGISISDIEGALLSVTLGSILELLIYVMFNDIDNELKEISLEHVELSMRTLNILLLVREINEFYK